MEGLGHGSLADFRPVLQDVQARARHQVRNWHDATALVERFDDIRLGISDPALVERLDDDRQAGMEAGLAITSCVAVSDSPTLTRRFKVMVAKPKGGSS
jgi:hypothetical protein